MTDSPRDRLAQALDPYGDIAGIAVKAGVTARQMMNAQSARPVTTVAYLRICAAIRFDPAPDIPKYAAFPDTPSDFDFAFFSMAFWMKRGMNLHTDRQAAKLVGVSPSTICRIERGDAMFIGVVIRACKYIEIHPFGYFCVPNPPHVGAGVSRGTKDNNTVLSG